MSRLKAVGKRIPYIRTVAQYLRRPRARDLAVADAIDLRTSDFGELACFYQAGGRPAIIRYSLAKCRWSGPTGFSYGPDSAHPYVQTALELQRSKRLLPEDSALWRFYEHYRPLCLAEHQGLDPEDCHPLVAKCKPVNTLPWSGSGAKDFLLSNLIQPDGPPASLTRKCGPHPLAFVEKRIGVLNTLYKTLSRDGFWETPPAGLPYFSQFPVGDILLNGEQAVLMLANGQHRAAVLSALGHQETSVLIGVQHARGPAMIRRDDVKDWPLVKTGVYSEMQALAIFDGIFEGRGRAY